MIFSLPRRVIFAPDYFLNWNTTKSESPIQKKFIKKWNRKMTQTNSVFTTFKVDYEFSRKYIVVVSVNNKLIRFLFEMASNITLTSQSTWGATNHKTRSAFKDKVHLTSELTCKVFFFQNFIYSGVCYLVDNSELNLIGFRLDWTAQYFRSSSQVCFWQWKLFHRQT